MSKTELTQLQQQINVDAVIEAMMKQKVLSKKQSADSLTFYRGTGCKKCSNEGYKGRVGIYEVLEVTREIRELMMHDKGAEAIRDQARSIGMTTIMEDGFTKALAGVTTLEEIIRATKE
jgi:type II secretory ATPase GspE/PulE/Tfp pilus assembly ATPase PilB-like protein